MDEREKRYRNAVSRIEATPEHQAVIAACMASSSIGSSCLVCSALQRQVAEISESMHQWRNKYTLAQAKMESMAFDFGETEGLLKRCQEELQTAGETIRAQEATIYTLGAQAAAKRVARDEQMKALGSAEIWDQIAAIGANVTEGAVLLSAGYAKRQADEIRRMHKEKEVLNEN